MSRASCAIVSRVLLVTSLGSASAHPGGLNAEGCHSNRKTGDYHCHGRYVELSSFVYANDAQPRCLSVAA